MNCLTCSSLDFSKSSNSSLKHFCDVGVFVGTVLEDALSASEESVHARLEEFMHGSFDLVHSEMFIFNYG